MELYSGLKSTENDSEIKDLNEFLLISLDSFLFAPWDKVTGEVLIACTSSEACLYIEAYAGEEIVVFGGNKQILDKKSKEIFNVQQLVTKIDNPGQYVAPFTLKLPSHCPPSFHYSFTDSSGCVVQSSVVYKIQGKLVFPQSNLTHFKTFTVKSLETLSPVNFMENQVVVDGCCMANGVTQVQVAFTNSSPIELGNELKVTLKINNQNCSAGITRIRIDVVMNVEVFTNKQSFRNSRILASRTREVNIRQNDVQSFGLFLALEGDSNPCSLTTSLITCDFSAIFTFSYNFFCCSKTSSFQVPLKIDPQAEIPNSPPSLPEDWSPSEKSITALLWS